MADSFDASDLNALALDFAQAGRRTQLAAVKAVTMAGELIERDARMFASGIGHAPHYPESITHDVTIGTAGIEVEIGPDKDLPQGDLGNILEFGTAKNAPITHLGPAFDRGVSVAVAAIAKGADPW